MSSTFSLAPYVMALMSIAWGVPLALGAVAGVALGVLVGAVNGIITVRFRVPRCAYRPGQGVQLHDCRRVRRICRHHQHLSVWSADPAAGGPFLTLQAIAAFIGGTSLLGGSGTAAPNGQS